MWRRPEACEPFFLENAGAFTVSNGRQAASERRARTELFFSRRIGIGPGGREIPILGGARVSGNVSDSVSVGLLNMQTEAVGGVAPANNFSGARVRRDLPNHPSNQSVTSEDPPVYFPTRPVLMDRLARSIRRAQVKDGYTFAVLVVKIDNFELVSDTLGRADRDRLLSKVGNSLADSVRPSDLVACLDSGEFCVLVDRIDNPDDLAVIAARIEKSLKRPVSLGAQEIAVTVGIGVAVSGRTARGPYDLLKDAATAMHRAQALGPGRYEMFDRAMRARAAKRLKLETDLRLAVERQQFTLHYQPILTLRTGAIHGFEALIRWQHPQLGLLAPAKFIPAAEELGLVTQISAWVLLEACRQMQEWNERFAPTAPLSVSMNFTSAQFAQTAVVETASEVLEQTGLDGSALVVEITESVLLHDTAAARATLERLRRMKVRVYLDDFGTGFSSLSYLHQLPTDAVKIDRSFVSRLGMPEPPTS